MIINQIYIYKLQYLFNKYFIQCKPERKEKKKKKKAYLLPKVLFTVSTETLIRGAPIV